MLPSRGLLRSSPASVLRTWSTRSQPTRSLQASPRYFSQISARSSLPRSTLGAPLRQSLTGSRTEIAITASGVFAQRSGASRNLSLWPFSSKPKQTPTESEFANPTTTTETPTPISSSQASSENSLNNTYSTSTPEVSAANPSYPVDANAAQYSQDSFSDLDLTSVLDIPEQIGYLKNLGLDFGWGPTSCCEWVLEHVYISTGMPWWGALATMALAWRVAIFYPTLSASKHAALGQQLQARPDFLQAKADMEEAAYRTKDQVAMMRARNKMSAIRKEVGANMWAPMIGFLTIPFSFGMFRLFRAMAALPVPSLETGGFGWFTDLTVHDPYFILPAASIAVTVLMFQQTQAANLVKNPMTENIQKGMKYVLPPMMFLCTAWLPAGIQWFFVVFSAGAVVQTTATLNPAVRRWADLPPLPSSSNQSTLMPSNPNGAVWQAPTKPKTKAPEAQGSSFSSLMGNSKQKEEWTKAQQYEERRAAEEKEKAFRRLEDIRRRQAGKQRR